MKRELQFIIPNGGKSLYLRFAEGIRLTIQKGLLRPGELLPSTRELAQTHKLHRHTVMSGLEELISEGWITSLQRKNYSVSETLPNQFFEARGVDYDSMPLGKHDWRLVQDLKLPQLFYPHPGIKCNFRSGIPDLREFPIKEFKSLFSDSLNRSGPKLLNYGNPLGHEPLVEEVKNYLRRVRSLKAEHVIVTHGSQEAIFLIAQLLLKNGDKVAVEELGYQPALAAFKAAGAQLIPLKIDSEGLDPDAFERAAQKHKLRLLYITPLHQYPTTVTLNISRRLRIYKIAEKYGIPILEDDYDHEFHYRSQPLAPMASHDPAGLVIYVSTLSKIFSPSARIGFMSVPERLIGPLSDYKRIVTRQNDILLQDVVARWMKSGGFERHLRRMRRLYETRRDLAVKYLSDAQNEELDIAFRIPDGGMAVWVDLLIDSALVAQATAKKRVFVACEAEFQVQQRKGTGLRLSFASQNQSEIKNGMTVLIDAIKLHRKNIQSKK